MTKDIFISYRRHDSAFFAAKLRDRLEQAFPGQVFLDVSGIDAGDDFAEKLKSAVAASKALVAVIGPGWLVSRDGARKLGEEGDFVTEEIAAAIESGITIVPVLVDGARMPAIDELPPRLRELSRRNAVSISHERFDSDSKHLVEALYKPLGIEPPNRIEKILELAGVGATYSQRTRDRLAVISILAACLGAFLTGLWVVVSRSDPQEVSTPLLVSGLALAFGILGRNSLRWRRAALVAIVVSASAVIAGLGLSFYRAIQMPFDPWMASSQAAQLHSRLPTFPADQIAWSNRAPFTVPLPTVACPCFSLVDKPAGTPPHPSDAAATF